MERALLVASTVCFFVSFGWTMFALGAGRYRPSRFNLVVIGLGFLALSGSMYLRGQALGRCPLTNLFEALVFLSWSMVLLYLLIGPTYRLTLLGAFTAPFATLFQMVALMGPPGEVPAVKPVVDPWLELHAAVSVVAYGAFALACVAGVMLLVQERQLKTHHLRSMFFHVPPISALATAIRRLIWAGVGLLTAGLASGFVVGSPPGKIAWGGAVWLLYAVLLAARRRFSARRQAQWAVGVFGLTLVSLWAFSFMR
jgi:ABC-type uncharacterized transport system permease subunit